MILLKKRRKAWDEFWAAWEHVYGPSSFLNQPHRYAFGLFWRDHKKHGVDAVTWVLFWYHRYPQPWY